MGARALWGEADMGCMWMCDTRMILICCASVSLFLKWGFCLPCGEAMTTNQIMPVSGNDSQLGAWQIMRKLGSFLPLHVGELRPARDGAPPEPGTPEAGGRVGT